MANIDLQKKKPGMLPWIIGLLLLALVIWGVVEMLDDDREQMATTEVEESAAPALETEQPVADVALIPVTVIVRTPVDYAGRTVTGTARVVDVISDRGFWIEQDGNRLFAVIDEPVPETIDVNTGQTVQLSATVYTSAMLDQLPGTLEQQARKVASEQEVFLYVKAQDLTITNRPPSTP